MEEFITNAFASLLSRMRCKYSSDW